MFSNMQSETLNELFAALSKAQGEMTSAINRNVNPFYKSKYATLEDVRLAYQEPLTKYGLCLVQTQTLDAAGKLYLITTLGHTTGQWIKSVLPLQIGPEGSRKGNPLHELGSSITYLRRYAITSLLGIATGDKEKEEDLPKNDEDDGNALTVSPKINVSQLNNLVKLLADDVEQKEYLTNRLRVSGIAEFKDITTDLYPKIIDTLLDRKAKAKAVTV